MLICLYFLNEIHTVARHPLTFLLFWILCTKLSIQWIIKYNNNNWSKTNGFGYDFTVEWSPLNPTSNPLQWYKLYWWWNNANETNNINHSHLLKLKHKLNHAYNQRSHTNKGSQTFEKVSLARFGYLLSSINNNESSNHCWFVIRNHCQIVYDV